MKKLLTFFSIVVIFSFVLISTGAEKKFSAALHGLFKYKDFQRSAFCRQCHKEIYYQWQASMMSQAYTHEWDEIEYFKLAVGHGKRNPKFRKVADECNGCHTPFAFMSGDTPPPRPSKKSMANESVSCDVCHTISGYNEEKLFNFSFYPSPGRTKYGNRGGKNSPVHDLKKSSALGSAKFCGTCHNEKNPWGIWVKSTYNEWLEGPYSKEGVPCHTCHMPEAPGRRSITEKTHYPNVKQHLFHGAHVQSKTSGAIDVLIQPGGNEFEPGEKAVFTVQLFNQKCGHKVPTGSVEDRMLYLIVEAEDSKGKKYLLSVDKKGFKQEEYTISSNKKAYQDFADMMDVPPGYNGLPRDGIPEGSRIFRMPYFTEKGEMTICQWNTASLGTDYRIGPRETKIETFTWVIPDEIPEGNVKITATLNYRLLVKPVADFLKVPEEESKDRLINRGETKIEIFY